MIDGTAAARSPAGSRLLRSFAVVARSKRGRAILLLNAMLCFIGIIYGFDYLYPRPVRPLIYDVATLGWLAGLATLLRLALAGEDAAGAAFAGALARIGPGLCCLQLALTLYFNLSTALAVPAIVLAAVLVLILDRWRSGAGFAAALLGGAASFALAVVLIPSGRGADMLPYIAHAIDVFLAGRDPYAEDFGPPGANPFFYLPLQWLIYLPARAAGLDVRLVNLASWVAMIAIVERTARRQASPAGLRTGIYPLLLSPLVFPMIHAGQVVPYWLALLGFGILALHHRWTGAAAMIGLAIGMRQTAIVPAAAIFVGLAGRLPPNLWLRCAAIGAAVVLATLLPIAEFLPAALDQILIEGPKAALAVARAAPDPFPQIAASAILDRLGLEAYDVLVEGAVAVAFFPIARSAARKGVPQLLCASGVIYALTIAFNPYLYRYYYVGGLLLFAIGIAGEPPARERASA